MTKLTRYSGHIMTVASPGVALVSPTAPARTRPHDEVIGPHGQACWFDLVEFVGTEYPRVVSAVWMIAGDHETAADAVQDALVKLLTGATREWPRNVGAWVTVVASNRVRDLRRRDAVGRRVMSRLRPGPADDPVERAGRDLDVLAALDTLPRRMRQICVLHYLQDRSVQEIADALGIGTGTVKTQLHRGRAALALRLAR